MAGIGILDLQGGVVEHLEHLQRLGVPAVRVKKAADFADLAGLIVPGGESTCLSRLLRITGLDQVIRERHGAGLPIWGTCAGAILLAREIDGESAHLGLMDIRIARNAFGSQLDSFKAMARVPSVAADPIPLTFIRAPKIVHLGEGVRSLLQIDDFHAAAEDDRTLATVFHPELTPSLAFHRYFARKCGIQPIDGDERPWRPEDWTRLAPLPGRSRAEDAQPRPAPLSSPG
jgi:5'-phosphate synthase pdxT subunit